MPPADSNNTYTKPPSENQILEFIKTLGYDEDPDIELIAVSKMVATRIHQPWRAILSVLNRSLAGKDSSWDTNEFEWQAVERSSKPSKMSKLLYTRFTKLIIVYLLSHNKSIPHRSVPDAMISDAIKKKAGYTYYMEKKVETEKSSGAEEPGKQIVSPVRRGIGKGYMFSGGNEANVPKLFKKDVVPRKTRSLTVAEETVKLKGPTVEDLIVQSLLDLRKGSKASRLESLKQRKQGVTGEGSSVAHSKQYDDSETNSDAILYSLRLDEIDDADESDMDLLDDNP
ncbi:hypothetical protein Tco_0010626 [Tanacetum coccineum]